MIIAIDGPAGSGKSTIAQLLSKKLDLEYIDSGAIYRSLTLYGIREFDGQVEGHEESIAMFFECSPMSIDLTWENHQQKMLLFKEDISTDIRTQEVTRQIKWVANNPACRDIVNNIIRKAAAKFSFVIDGRDIGTVVFPNAENKFYLDATPEIRATRRAKELDLPLEGKEFEKLKQEIILRDKSDMEREIAPLKKADDAHYIDTSDLNIEEVLEAIKKLIA